jgi:hypothetical protein
VSSDIWTSVCQLEFPAMDCLHRHFIEMRRKWFQEVNLLQFGVAVHRQAEGLKAVASATSPCESTTILNVTIPSICFRSASLRYGLGSALMSYSFALCSAGWSNPWDKTSICACVADGMQTAIGSPAKHNETPRQTMSPASDVLTLSPRPYAVRCYLSDAGVPGVA